MHAFRTVLTIFPICWLECRRIVLFHFLSVCGLDFSAIYGAWFRVLVIGLQLAIRSGVGLHVRSLCLRFSVVRGSRFLSLIYTGDSGWIVCPVALFATSSGSWFGILVADFPI